MNPIITIFGWQFSSYGILCLLGIGSAVVFCLIMSKKENLIRSELINALAYASIGALLGAKLFYIVATLPALIQNIKVIFSSFTTFASYMTSGFVFYGGLFGAVCGFLLYGREFHMNMLPYLRVCIPAIPLFHVFGRFGCYLSGCCYGKVTESFLGMLYHSNYALPHDAIRYPVQLMEASCNMVIFIVLLIGLYRKWKCETLAGVYLILYAGTRFGLEMLRGDDVRGVYLLSFSQWISIACFCIGGYLLYYASEHRQDA